jgi:CPA1 family monovalent cation:H+ antiporter
MRCPVSGLEFLFVLLLAAVVLVRLAERARLPYPIVLVLAGLAIGLVPGLPDVELEPDVIFLVFLPPLLVEAAYSASPQELFAERRPLAFLTIGLVVLTIGTVAIVAHALIDGLPWAAAFALGAIVAPTDPVAAIATFSRIGVPDRVRLLVEGESLLNDATALVALRVALSAAGGAAFDAGGASWDLVKAVAGGIAIGLVAGWLGVQVVRRVADKPLAILWTVLSSWGSYIVAEEAGVSGVLAAVLCGLYFGWHQHQAFDADTRLSAQAFWEVLTFTLNALIFILLGLQFPTLSDELREQVQVGELAVAGLAIAGALMSVRLLAQFAPFVHTGDTWRERLIVGWSGMRGAISLAAALSVPLDVTGRNEIVVVTFVVILVTLVGQGLTLPVLLKALRVRPDRIWSPEEAIARLEAAQAALDRLEELEAERDGDTPEPVRRLRELYRARFRMCQAVLTGEPDARDRAADVRFRYGALRRELIGVERHALLDLRADGRLRPDVMRLIERDLDLEEARLAAA